MKRLALSLVVVLGAAGVARESAAQTAPGAEACARYRDAAAGTGSPDARRQLALCLARLGRGAYQANRAAEAVAHYRQALDVFPDAPDLWTALAIAYVKAGDLARAQSLLREALARFPADAETLYALADVQERQGRTGEAAETIRRLLRGHPDHARGRRLLSSLEREQRVEGAYWSQESANFLVRYEGATGLDVGRSVVDLLEEARESLGRELGVLPRERMQVGIYAAPVFGDVTGAPPHAVAGAYDGKKIRLNLGASAAASRSLARLVRHEYAHALIHLASNGRAPVWVHEGLAQVLEPRDPPRFLEISVPREHLTLAGIERLSRSGTPEAMAVGYSLTHVAVAHLVDRGGMAGIRAFLGRLGQGQPVATALREAFGVGPEALDARLLAVAGRP